MHNFFSHFSTKNVVGTQKNDISEMVPQTNVKIDGSKHLLI